MDENRKRKLGIGLIVIGLLVLFYFVAIFDVTIPVPQPNFSQMSTEDVLNYRREPIQRVNNIGLTDDRQVGVMLGLGSLIIGVILLTTARPSPTPAPGLLVYDTSPITYNAPKPTTRSNNPHTQWLLDCQRADAEGFPRPPKPQITAQKSQT